MSEITGKDFQRICERAIVDGVLTDDELETVIMMCCAATRLGVPMEHLAMGVLASCGYQSRNVGQEVRHLVFHRGALADFTTYSWLFEGTRDDASGGGE